MNELNALVASISTKRDLMGFVSKIEEVQRGLFKSKSDVEEFLSEKFPASLSSSIISYAASEKVDLEDAIVATEFFSTLANKLKSLPVATLRVAFDPTSKNLKTFSNYIYENTQKHIILDVVRDSSLMGGAVVEFEGRVGNYSLSKRLQSLFDKQITSASD